MVGESQKVEERPVLLSADLAVLRFPQLEQHIFVWIWRDTRGLENVYNLSGQKHVGQKNTISRYWSWTNLSRGFIFILE